MSESTERAAFEAAISASPYERSVARFPDDAQKHGWPSIYRDPAVNLAWYMWQARASQSAPSPVEDVRKKALKEAEDCARCYDLGTPEGHAIADCIRALAQEGAKE